MKTERETQVSIVDFKLFPNPGKIVIAKCNTVPKRTKFKSVTKEVI